MSKKAVHEIKVAARIETVRAAGRWFDTLLKVCPSATDRLGPDNVKFITSLSRRSGASIRMDPSFAERFVECWSHIFLAAGLEHLFVARDDGEARPPVEGGRAVAELVFDIAASLRRGEGAPLKIDPVQTWEAVQRKRSSTVRGRKHVLGGKMAAIDDLAKELRVSRNTLDKASRQGKAFIEFLQEAVAGQPLDLAIRPIPDTTVPSDESALPMPMVRPKGG